MMWKPHHESRSCSEILGFSTSMIIYVSLPQGKSLFLNYFQLLTAGSDISFHLIVKHRWWLVKWSALCSVWSSASSSGNHPDARNSVPNESSWQGVHFWQQSSWYLWLFIPLIIYDRHWSISTCKNIYIYIYVVSERAKFKAWWNACIYTV